MRVFLGFYLTLPIIYQYYSLFLQNIIFRY